MNFQIKKETLLNVYFLICTLVLVKAFTWIYTGQSAYILDASTSQGMRMFSALNYVLLISLLWSSWKILAFNRSLLLLQVTFIFFLCSALWASEPKESARMSLSILFQFALACALVKNASMPVLLGRLGFISRGILLVNLVFMVMFSGLAYETGYFEGSYSGALRGIFSSKNAFGAIIAWCCTFLYVEWQLGARTFKQQLLWLILAVAMLVMSMSATALITALGAIGLTFAISTRFFHAMGQKGRLSLIVGLSLVLSFFMIAIEPLLALMGRDITLTGRTILWDFAWTHYEMKPLLGFGLNSFWREMLQSNALIQAGLWDIGQAHNGFIDAFVAGGLVGGLLIIAIYCKMLWTILQDCIRKELPTYLPLMLALFWLGFVQNLTETSFPYGIRITGTLIALFFLLRTQKKSS